MQILIRKSGNLVDVSPDGAGPLPDHLTALLTPSMTYVYKRLLRGAAAYDPMSGTRSNIALETRRLYRMEQGRLTCGFGYVPRIVETLRKAGCTLSFQDLSPPPTRSDCYTQDWEGLRQVITFRARQDECVQSIVNNPGGIVKAPTGFGKTHTIAALGMLYPQARIHVIIKSVDVAERTVRRLTAFMPNIGQIGGGKHYWGRITVITADSLHLSDFDADFVFCDEVHQLASETYSAHLGKYRHARIYGFSATPYARMDGAHARLECLCGPTIFEMSYAEAVALGLVVPIRVGWIPVRSEFNPAKDRSGVSRKRWGIWRNEFRNQAIADKARGYAGDVQVLALVETVEHAIHLWRHMPEFALCYGDRDEKEIRSYKKSGLLPENYQYIDGFRRQQMRRAFEGGQLKKVIATDVWQTGVDFEQLQVLCRCDDRDSDILDTQGPGRVSRIYDGKECGIVHDCIDYFDKSLYNKSRGRFRSYQELEWEQDWPKGRRQISDQ